MASEEEIRRVFIGKHILVSDKKFEIVNASIHEGRVIFDIRCEGFPGNITRRIDAKANEQDYLQLYQDMIQEAQARQQPTPQPAQAPTETRSIEGELKKIEPKLEFVYSPIEMIGKAINVKREKYGITKENADRAYSGVLSLERGIEVKRLSKIIKKVRLEEGDASGPTMYVSKRMNLIELIDWVKRVHNGLDKIWWVYESRIRKIIRVLKSTKGKYASLLGEDNFNKPDDAKYLYTELRNLEPNKLRIIFQIRGRIAKETEKRINKEILHYQKQDRVWMYHWNLLAVAIYLINHKLIPKINQAISRQGQQGRRQQEGRVPEVATEEEPLELKGEQ